jgi:hypothetical protein
MQARPNLQKTAGENTNLLAAVADRFEFVVADPDPLAIR